MVGTEAAIRRIAILPHMVLLILEKRMMVLD